MLRICLATIAALATWLLWLAWQITAQTDTNLTTGAFFNLQFSLAHLAAALLCVITCLLTAYILLKSGARRTLIWLVALAVVGLGGNYILRMTTGVNFSVAPALLGSALSFILVYSWQLIATYRELGEGIERAAQSDSLEIFSPAVRLQNGLQLLQTILPMEEGLVFQLNEQGALEPAARLRRASSGNPSGGSGLEGYSNSLWREGVKLCETALRLKSVQSSTSGSQLQITSQVAIPLRHDAHNIGALLLRLRGEFDPEDEPLVSAVATQMARSLQRNEARQLKPTTGFWSSLSIREAQHKLEAFGVVSGLLIEQRFGAQALSEVPSGQMVAYLDGTIASANDFFLKFVDLTATEARELGLFGVLERLRVGVFDEPALAVRRVLQTAAPYERELTYTEHENQTVLLRIALVNDALRANGDAESENAIQPLCLSVSVLDVTRLKEHAQLRSDMVSLIAHELRTPLTSINGFAELLADDPKIPAESREFLHTIRAEAHRLTKMINTFLSVKRLEAADRQDVILIPVKLDDIVRETLSTLNITAKKKRIRLTEQHPIRLPPVAADKMLMTQVVSNLVDNAIRYSPERSTVIISTDLEAEAVRVSVEDRGYGIPPDSLARVWEKFYRVPRAGQEKDEASTGLGLSFVREVVEQHGGTVTVESEIGRGSTFSFTIPRL